MFDELPASWLREAVFVSGLVQCHNTVHTAPNHIACMADVNKDVRNVIDTLPVQIHFEGFHVQVEAKPSRSYSVD
jgi:hypothetical protein